MEQIKEYKSRAYDLLVIIQNAQNELDQVNKKIIELSSIKEEEIVK